MAAQTPTMTIPLHTDAEGTIRVSNTRVTLDTLIARYQMGDTPEQIHAAFDVLPLNNIYAVIAYYLSNRDELDAYLQQREEAAQRLRDEIEANYTPEQRALQERLKRLIDEKRREQGS